MEDTGRSHRSYYRRMKRYLYDFWNVVDLLSYSLLTAALWVRHFHPSDTFTVSRRMFSLSLLVMYLRFLEVFLIHRKMGPTLIMIKEMVNTFYLPRSWNAVVIILRSVFSAHNSFILKLILFERIMCILVIVFI